MQALLSIVTLFSGPLGQLFTNALGVGSAAFVAWQIKQGVPADAAANVAGAVGVLISTGINVLTGTQIATIRSVRASTDNGVTVVPVDAARRANIQSVDAPVKK